MTRQLLPSEQRAVRRVERALRDLPPTVALYFHGDRASVMDCDEDGYIVGIKDGGYPREAAVLGSINTRRCAAGDF